GVGIPFALELIDEPVEEPCLRREVVILLLIICRRAGPVRGTEDRLSESVKHDHLLVVQSLMRAYSYLDARVVKKIDVISVPRPARISIFVLLREQANRYSPIDRADSRVGITVIRDSIHYDVDLLSLLIHFLRRSIEKVLGVISARRKVERGIDRRDRISP